MCEAVLPVKQEGQKSHTYAWKFPKFHELLHIVDDMACLVWVSSEFLCTGPRVTAVSCSKSPWETCAKANWGFCIWNSGSPMFGVLVHDWHNTHLHMGQSSLWFWYTWQTSCCWHHWWWNFSELWASILLCLSNQIGSTISVWNPLGHQNPHRFTNSSPWIDWAPFQFVKDCKDLDLHFAPNTNMMCICLWCHPCYQLDGPIYDWMIIDFGDLGKFPSRLAIVVVVVVDSPQGPEEKYQLVVQSTTEEIQQHVFTLFREWYWSPTYHLVSCNNIVDHCFVIFISHNSSTVLETKLFTEWASQFT